MITSRTIRRRILHGDVDGKRYDHLNVQRSDSLSEPLLGNHGYDDSNSEWNGQGNQPETWDEQRKELLHWRSIFFNLITQWSQWLTNIMLGSGSLLGKFLPIPFDSQNDHDKNFQISLSPLQVERLRNLQQRLEISFEGTCLDHQDALKQLWRLAYPDRELPSLKSDLWKQMGWQGPDPSTDFRGGGFISLENLIFFANRYPDSFQSLLHKKDGRRADWEYPFAVAGINISFMLVQMLNLQSGKPTSMAGVRFLELLGEDEMAFDNLYCVAFQMMDAQWLAKRASYMEFNEVLKSTRIQLERELAFEDVSSIKDLPAYNLLKV